jgi:hypothetical protein
MASKLFTRTFWQSLMEQAIGFASTGVVVALSPHATDLFSSVPWANVASGAAIGAVLGVATGLASLKVGPGKDNGNASFNSHIVAQ